MIQNLYNGSFIQVHRNGHLSNSFETRRSVQHGYFLIKECKERWLYNGFESMIEDWMYI